jgi:GNAT superfamily N-acetyltransferase
MLKVKYRRFKNLAAVDSVTLSTLRRKCTGGHRGMMQEWLAAFVKNANTAYANKWCGVAVAYVDGQAIGWGFTAKRYQVTRRKWNYQVALFVRPQFRGEGIGTKLAKTLIGKKKHVFADTGLGQNRHDWYRGVRCVERATAA